MKKLLILVVSLCVVAAVAASAIAVKRANEPREFLENFPNGVEAELEAEGLPVLSADYVDYGAPSGPHREVYFVVPEALCADGDVQCVIAVFTQFDWVWRASENTSFDHYLSLSMIAPNGNGCTASVRTVPEGIPDFIKRADPPPSVDLASKGVWAMEYACSPGPPSGVRAGL